MANTYEGTIDEAAISAVEDILKNGKVLTPDELRGDILARSRNDILMYNSIAQPGAKWKIPTELVPFQVAYVLIKLHRVAVIETGAKVKNKDKMLLGIYAEDGEYKGTYITSESEIRRIARRYKKSLTRKELGEVMDILHEEAPRMKRCEEKNLVPVNNGIFDFDTKQLMPFTPDKVFLSKSQVDYNPFAKNIIIHNDGDNTDWDVESWILDIMDDKPDMAELIWQVIGATVRPFVSWNRACFMYSEVGNNGKGTLCVLLRNLVGEESHTSIPLADFGKDFMLEPLIGTSAIIVDENDVGTYLDKVGNLKAVITGDVIQINMKFKTPISFRYKGFMVQCLNELPRIKDKSDSFYRRQLFIPFTKSFTGKERKYIKDDYLNRKEVLEYVLFRVLNMNYDDFDVPQECKDVLDEYKSFNDPVRQFMEEIMPQLAWDLVPFTFLYDLYKAWYKKNIGERDTKSKQVFTKDLLNILPEYTDWICENKAKTYKPGNKMDKPEPLIFDYKLEEWRNPNYSGNDVNKICQPVLKATYSGILRV